MSQQKQGLQRRSLLQRVLGGALLGTAGLFARAASAADAPAAVTAPVVTNIGIAVADLEKSMKFYGEVFGFKPAKPIKIGAALSGLLEAENLDLTIQFMETGGARIELLSFTNPKPVGDGMRKPTYGRGLTHLQIKVPNVAAAVDAARKAGGTVLDNTKLGKGDVIQAIFILDPDGTRLELVP